MSSVTKLQTNVLDRELALERLGGDEELLREIARLFLDDYPKLMSELREAVESGDARRIERSAHSIKGSVANFAADPVCEAAFALEQIGRSGKVDTSVAALRTLEEGFAALRPALEDLAK